MKVTFIAGMQFEWSDPQPFKIMGDYLSTYGFVEAVEYRKHTDQDLLSIETDLLVGHSFGAYEALAVFNSTEPQQVLGCMCLDYVDEDDFWHRLALRPATAARPGVFSLHRPATTDKILYPRSVGVLNAVDEIIDIQHDDFVWHPRTAELITHWLAFRKWK